MATVRIDRIEEGYARKTARGWTIQRVAFVSGITGSAHAILPRAILAAGMPQEGDAHPTVPAARVTGHYAAGADGDSAVVYVTYESPQSPGDQSGGRPAFTVMDDTSLRTIQTQIIGGKPVRVFWRADGQNSGEPGPGTITETATIPVDEDVRNLTLWGVVSERDLNPFRAAVGRVNKSRWLGLEKGGWRFSRFATDTQDRGRTYAVTAAFEGRTFFKDWRTFQLLRHPDSGKFCIVKPGGVAQAEGIPYPDSAPSFRNYNGVTVVFPYRTIDFRSLFGIS